MTSVCELMRNNFLGDFVTSLFARNQNDAWNFAPAVVMQNNPDLVMGRNGMELAKK